MKTDFENSFQSEPRIIHVIAPYLGDSPLARRQELFFESIDSASREDVTLLALVNGQWQREGWEVRDLTRDARLLGDDNQKPFIRDLYDHSCQLAAPRDWILYTNTDCAVDQTIYQNLRSLSVTAVEYMRLDVEGDPRTLSELFANQKQNYSIGLDGLALRAGFWAEIREFLPDFLIGEPHWDTTYSGILRRIIPVWRDKGRLFHPKHDQVWDLANPTPGGRHNHSLYYAAVAYGHSATSQIQDQQDLTDTAVICASFGNDPARIKANVEGISKQLDQDLYADFYLVEVVPGSGKSAYPESLLSRLHHLPVQGSDDSADLFQKESLLNHGWRTALKSHSYDYFIFTDADIYSRQHDWFRQIRAKLLENPARAVQGFRMVRDTRDAQIHYSSLGSAYVLGHQTDLPLNPGLCWAFYRSVLEMGNGFNAECIECAGDSALVAEYLNWDHFLYDPYLYQFAWFGEIERDLPFRVELQCVPVDIVHVHHGYLTERNYDGVRYALDGMPPLGEMVGRDDKGLLCWKNPDCPERVLLRQRHRMGTREEVDRLFKDFNYTRFERKDPVARHKYSKKPLFEIPEGERRLNRNLPTMPVTPRRADSHVLNLFNPAEVFRSDFPFSWCDGVKKVEDSTFIPIGIRDGLFSLVLDGLPESDYIIGVVPIQPSWEPFDLSGFSTINLALYVSGAMSSDVKVQLDSKDEEGVEYGSRSISLLGNGLIPEQRMEFCFPLHAFSGEGGFLLQQTRLFKIIGENSFRIELARLYIN